MVESNKGIKRKSCGLLSGFTGQPLSNLRFARAARALNPTIHKISLQPKEQGPTPNSDTAPVELATVLVSSPLQLADALPQDMDQKKLLTPQQSGAVGPEIAHCTNEQKGDLGAVPTLVDTSMWEADEDYEPFDSYQYKVAQLACQSFPHASKITVERMRGGFENRTIGLTVFDPLPNAFVRIFRHLFHPSCEEDKGTQYILRIPRGPPNGLLEQQVATLCVVAAKTSLPVAKVVQYSTSVENPLKSGYMIQTRLQGQPLANVKDHLNPKQFESVLKGFMHITETLAGVQSNTAGEITEDNISLSMEPHSSIHLGKYLLPPRGQGDDPSFPKPRTWPASPQDTLAVLLEQCQRWEEYPKHEEQGDDLYGWIWKNFGIIFTALQKQGFLDGPFSLVHGDLADHNVLVIVGDENTVEITGVVDWDYAMLVPKFVAYGAPYWMWLDERTLSWHHERNVNHEPKTENGRIAKEYFQANASDEWKKFAFAPEAIIARQLFDFAIRGIDGSWDTEVIDACFEEWNKLHPEDKVRTTDPFYDWNPLENSF